MLNKPVFTDFAEAVCVARFSRDLMDDSYAVYSAFPPIMTVELYDPQCYREYLYLAHANVPTLPRW